MTVRIISLSYPVSTETPTYGNLPKPKIVSHTSIAAGNTSNSSAITVHNHTSTHVDAPAHFVSNGKAISDYLSEELIFRKPLLVDIPKEPGEWVEADDLKKRIKSRGVDCLLICTGFWALRSKDVYRTHNPGLSPEAVLWARHLKSVRCIGIDSISVSGFQDRARGRKAHQTAFGKIRGLGEPLLLVEDMNLGILKTGQKIRKITIAPWLISGVDSAPCTVLAEVVEHE